MTLTVESAVANYKAIFADAFANKQVWEAGLCWYLEANKEACDIAITQIHPVIGGELTRSVRLAAALLAASSPAKDWDKGVNQLTARRWAAQMGAGKAPKGHFGFLNDKAQALWDYVAGGHDDIEVMSRILTKEESKVSRFFRNMLGDYEPITIDGHMINAAYNGMKFVSITAAKQTAKEVKICGEALVIAAEAYGLEPAVAQAVIWCAFKSYKGGK